MIKNQSCIKLLFINNFASAWPRTLKFLQTVYFNEFYLHLKYKKILEIQYAYYQNVMHCSAYRGKLIECDV